MNEWTAQAELSSKYFFGIKGKYTQKSQGIQHSWENPWAAIPHLYWSIIYQGSSLGLTCVIQPTPKSACQGDNLSTCKLYPFLWFKDCCAQGNSTRRQTASHLLGRQWSTVKHEQAVLIQPTCIFCTRQEDRTCSLMRFLTFSNVSCDVFGKIIIRITKFFFFFGYHNIWVCI